MAVSETKRCATMGVKKLFRNLKMKSEELGWPQKFALNRDFVSWKNILEKKTKTSDRNKLISSLRSAVY